MKIKESSEENKRSLKEKCLYLLKDKYFRIIGFGNLLVLILYIAALCIINKNGGAYDETINILVSFAIIINCLANGTYFILLISDNEKNQFKWISSTAYILILGTCIVAVILSVLVIKDLIENQKARDALMLAGLSVVYIILILAIPIALIVKFNEIIKDLGHYLVIEKYKKIAKFYFFLKLVLSLLSLISNLIILIGLCLFKANKPVCKTCKPPESECPSECSNWSDFHTAGTITFCVVIILIIVVDIIETIWYKFVLNRQSAHLEEKYKDEAGSKKEEITKKIKEIKNIQDTNEFIKELGKN